jgi:hypothetical protein
MRSQVQVLAGPPPSPQVKALSAASRERLLPAWAALGPRAHPHRPLRVRPPRGVRHHDHHSPWSPPSPDGRHAADAATSHRNLFPCPPQAASHRCSARRPGLPARSAGTRRRTQPGPGSPPTPTDQRDLAAPPASRLAGPSTEPLNGAAAHRDSTRSRGDGCPPQRPGPNATARYGRRRTRPDRRGGHQPAGHRMGGQQPAGHRMGGRTPEAGHRTGGQQTTGPPDTQTTTPGDRTPDGWKPHG